MSLLEEIWGDGPSDQADLEGSLRQLCAALLAENHLQPQAVVAARIRIPEGHVFPSMLPRELGWEGIPVFWEHGADGLRVVAHVRIKRRRRLRPVQLQEPLL